MDMRQTTAYERRYIFIKFTNTRGATGNPSGHSSEYEFHVSQHVETSRWRSTAWARHEAVTSRLLGTLPVHHTPQKKIELKCKDAKICTLQREDFSRIHLSFFSHRQNYLDRDERICAVRSTINIPSEKQTTVCKKFFAHQGWGGARRTVTSIKYV